LALVVSIGQVKWFAVAAGNLDHGKSFAQSAFVAETQTIEKSREM